MVKSVDNHATGANGENWDAVQGARDVAWSFQTRIEQHGNAFDSPVSGGLPPDGVPAALSDLLREIAPQVASDAGDLNPAKTLLECGYTDLIQYMVDHYRKIDSYQVTIKSSQSNTLGYYFKRPGHVRIEFIQPFGGAVIIYDPDSKVARLWPLGYPHFPAFTLDPENRLIRNSSGQRIDRSDFGALYQNMQTLQQHGKATLAESVSINGKNTLHLIVEGLDNFTIAGVHRFQLWVDQATAFPNKVSSHDAMGKILEVVEFEYLQINPAFPPDFFKQ